MATRELFGVFLMSVAGLLVVAKLLLRTMLSRLHMPYFPFASTANFLLAVATAGLIWHGRVQKQVGWGRWKWVWMRGVFGCVAMLCKLLALEAKAPLGDAIALASINVVVAALLGRVFLGERLGYLHIAAIGLSVVGACLVARPDMLWYPQAVTSKRERRLGYTLALASGMGSGSLFFVSRKLSDVSPVMGTFSVALFDGTGCWLVFLTGIVAEPPLSSVGAKPEMAALAMLLMVGVVFGSVACLSAASQMCPAAISSTVFTASVMTVGYAAQVLVHRELVEVLTMYGALAMLLAVSLMAVAAAQGKNAKAREAASEAQSMATAPAGPGPRTEAPVV